jgi:hypothetical protein
MIAKIWSRLACLGVALLGVALLLGPASAQQPSPAAIKAARELVELKGGGKMFQPVVIGVVDQTKNALMQTNPQLAKDLTEVGNQLRNEFAPRSDELVAQAARFYADRFTEQELKDLVAFYKTPLGNKMLVQEPLVLDDAFGYVQQWAPKIGEEVMTRFRAEMKKKGHNL